MCRDGEHPDPGPLRGGAPLICFFPDDMRVFVMVSVSDVPGPEISGYAACSVPGAWGWLVQTSFVLLCASLAMAFIAGVFDHLAIAMATRTGLLQRKESLLHAYLANTSTGSTGCWCSALFGT